MPEGLPQAAQPAVVPAYDMEKTADARLRDLVALASIPELAIDTSGLPESDGWEQAGRGRFWRPVKRSVTMRLDADVLDWFRRRKPKYGTAINGVLRAYMED